MYNKLISAALIIAIVASLLCGAFLPVQQAAADEAWTDIDTAAELDAIRSGLTGNYRLTADIDLSVSPYADGTGWVPIGTGSNLFRGKLDGNGHTIRNLTIDSTANWVGLFGETEGATFTDVRLTNVNVKGTSYVGGLIGFLGTGGTIAGSSVEGTVTGSKGVGMLVGYFEWSTMERSFAEGHLKSDSSNPDGGFGGLVGYLTENGTGRISQSYSSAVIDTGTNAGGLIGKVDGPPPLITSTYWDTVSSGIGVSSGGIGKTTSEMKQKDTYEGWDFSTTWGMIEKSTYPMHRAQYDRVTLASLAVRDASDSSTVGLDRAFASSYGDYVAYVPYKTDDVFVDAIQTYGGSTVTVNGASAATPVALVPGVNVISIVVEAAADLSATYTLTVYRDAGTSAYPHRISTAAQLAKIGDAVVEGYDLTDSYSLTADIDLSGYSVGAGWMPIGTSLSPFSGQFDGNGHTISNLAIDRSATDDVGLFGYSSHATIGNVALTNVTVAGDEHVGGLIGNAYDSSLSRIAVQGVVNGSSDVGGLAGVAESATVDESYSSAQVNGSANAGGLLGRQVASSVTDSFWDTETSQQATSAGGAGVTGKTKAEMRTKSTYTGWTFGPGNWGVIEGTTYPLPYASFVRASLGGLTVAAPGTTVAMNIGFDDEEGEYVATLAAPVAQASIAATAAAASDGATVAFTGAGVDAGGTVELDLGENPVEIRVTGPGGVTKGLYTVRIDVPTPQASQVTAPSDDAYGVGQQLKFTVEYSHAVDVTGTPALPLTLGSASVNAEYAGKSPGFPNRLEFVYVVQSGDLDTNGLSLGSAIVANAPSAISALGEGVPLTLPVSVPDMSAIVIDGIAPSIGLTPSPTAPTNDPVTVSVTADGTGSDIVMTKWAAGTHSASYFASAGTSVTGGAFQADDNGAYTVYAIDEAGNASVETVSIGNIISDLPTIALGYSPTGVTNVGVNVAVTAAANNEAGGNALTSLKWAEGAHSAAEFAGDPAFGEDVVSGSFHVSANGTYTVYASDSANNTKVETITIANIVTQPPTIALDYAPKNPGQTSVDVSVTATVYDPGSGNSLAGIRWAEGSRAASDFADPSFGLSVPVSGTFSVNKNGRFTVFAADAAGNVRTETIDISNIIIPSTWAPLPDPDNKQFYLVPGREYTLELDGLMKLTIPSGAIAEPMTITIRRATKDAESRLDAGQRLLADAFELTKNVPGKFAVPLRLEVRLKEKAGDKPVLHYYDEALKRWTPIESKAEGNAIAGETDHFTLFAVLPAQVELSDIEGHWAEKDIREGVTRGWVDGYPDGTFAPDRTVTRAEFAVMLARVLGWDSDQSLTFEDAATIPDWADEAIAGAVQAGVISGYPDRRFRPNESVGRAEAAVMMARAAGLTPAAAERTAFADDDAIAGWAKPFIEAGRQKGLLIGSGGNKFVPSAPMTRAEAIVFLRRLDAYIRRNE